MKEPTLERVYSSGKSVAEHKGLASCYFQTPDKSTSPYLNSQANKKTLEFICRTCYEKNSFRLDNLLGPSRSSKALKCSHNSNHKMLSPDINPIDYYDPNTHSRSSKSNWNVAFVNAFLKSEQWKKLQNKIPVLQNAIIVVDSKAHSGLGLETLGKWDFILSLPAIRKQIAGDIDTLTYHLGKEKSDFRKSARNALQPDTYTVRIREENLDSVFTSEIVDNGFEILDGFNGAASGKQGEKIDFEFAISNLVYFVEFIVLQYIMDIALTIDSPSRLTKFLNSVARIHGENFAKNVRDFVFAYNDYLESPGTFVFGKKHKSFYKAFFDNSLADNWTAKRAVSPVRRILGEYLRSKFR